MSNVLGAAVDIVEGAEAGAGELVLGDDLGLDERGRRYLGTHAVVHFVGASAASSDTVRPA